MARNYDGTGELDHLHATIVNLRDGWQCEVLEESEDRTRAEPYTYGETLPLTEKMAREIAERFVTGKKIPKRLEWR